MWKAALGSGLFGAVALTLLHEGARKSIRQAPRMDVLGERALAKGLSALGIDPPASEQLHQAALAGDLVSNSLYYSLVGVGSPSTAPARGALLGLLAGIGAIVLPGPMGLGSAPSNRSDATRAMTLGLYLAGGLSAGIAYAVSESLIDSARHLSPSNPAKD